MNPDITATLARDNGAKECVRCWRWTHNDGPEVTVTKGDRDKTGIICWRCQDVLCHEYPGHPTTTLAKVWREEHGLPV